MIPVINAEQCTACGNCLEVCPPCAIIMSGEGAVIEADFCEECGFCAAACPVGAIRIVFPSRGRG
jgi:ferredoxin